MEPILLGWVGEGGWAASLAERAVVVWELVEDCEAERLRPSSARMSSRETLRWGWVMGTSERFSTNLEAMVVAVEGEVVVVAVAVAVVVVVVVLAIGQIDNRLTGGEGRGCI
jgi:hypothetical protein